MEALSQITSIPPPPAPDASIGWPPPVAARSQDDGSSWAVWTLVTVVSIWTSVVLISVFSPDMISGSEHQRMPVAAFGTWLWGTGASIASILAMGRLRGSRGRWPLWTAFCGATIAFWAVAVVLSIFGPTMVTGSDPTTVPLAALISPIVAMLATVLVGIVVLVGESLTPAPGQGR